MRVDAIVFSDHRRRGFRCHARPLGRSRPSADRAFRRAAAARLRPRACRNTTSPTRRTARSNAARSNAVLICHALNASHHVAGFYADDPDNVGWWDNMVGPGQAARHRPLLRRRRQQPRQLLRLDRPVSIESRRPASRGAAIFRCVTVEDWVDAQAQLADRLGIGAVGRGDGRQPRRHAGARLGDPLSGAHPQRAGDRRGAEPVGARTSRSTKSRARRS